MVFQKVRASKRRITMYRYICLNIPTHTYRTTDVRLSQRLVNHCIPSQQLQVPKIWLEPEQMKKTKKENLFSRWDHGTEADSSREVQLNEVRCMPR